jgi:hypothetical protein
MKRQLWMCCACADKTGTLTRMPGFDVPHVLTLAALARTDVRYSQRIERNESCELHRCLRSPPPPPEPCRRRLCEADDYKYRVQTSETIISPVNSFLSV